MPNCLPNDNGVTLLCSFVFCFFFLMERQGRNVEWKGSGVVLKRVIYTARVHPTDHIRFWTQCTNSIVTARDPLCVSRLIEKKLLHFSMLLSHAEVTWIIVKTYSYLNNSRMSPAGWCVTEKYMRNWTSCACNRARDKMDALCIIKFLHLQSNAAKQFHYETFAEANASMRTNLHTNFLQHFSTNSYFCNWFVSSFLMWKIVWIISEWQCRCLIELHFVTLVLCLPGKLHVELMIWQPTRNTQKEVFVNCEERMTVILLKQNW